MTASVQNSSRVVGQLHHHLQFHGEWPHFVCVTVINVCVLNSWFRPGMPHRLSGPYVLNGNTLIGNFALQYLELVVSKAFLVGGKYWLFDIANKWIVWVQKEQSLWRCERRKRLREKPVLSCMARQSQPYACEFDMGWKNEYGGPLTIEWDIEALSSS